MLKLTVIATQESNKVLCGLIEGMHQEATDYAPGLDVKKDKEVPGKYIIEKHRGTITDDTFSVRVVDRNILAGNFAGRITRVLRGNKIPFQEYENVEIPNPNAIDLQINLNRKPTATYTA